MTDNERTVREFYRIAETDDLAGFISMFATDGYFYDVSAGKKYRGEEIADTMRGLSAAFPDMHRQLDKVYAVGDVVVVELSLNGTNTGPLAISAGTIAATGKEMHTPCCDVFHLEQGKVKSFHCYNIATIMLGQLGVLGNLGASMAS